jgi:uncharacterized protein
MRWTSGDRGNIDDMRGSSGGGFGVIPLGIGGFILVAILSMATGINFFSLLGGGGAGPTSGSVGTAGGPARSTPEEEKMVDFVDAVARDAQETWAHLLGSRYQPTKVVLFTDQIQSACGFAQAATGPFYCPGDRRVYLDLGFFDELRRRFGAPGDFAQAYVLAHEIGHHVQHLLGRTDEVRAQQERSPSRANALSVRLELQADCLAGIWAHSTGERRLLEEGDVDEALGAASAVGDDRIQKQAGGRVSPESWTHGSARQRSGWFRRGLETGRLQDCDTFRTALPGVEERAPLRSR